ncbi:MAG TPA: ABC transporter permease [Candidatus Polarisedimenticolaceae bacterium]|nr:ABC transporter permease [Candidatus Polarisedimenticolaceae bacterium]
MRSRLAPRLAVAALTLFLVTFAVFGLLCALPGDPLSVEGEHALPPAYIAALRAQFHLDDPWPVRYGRWLADVARGRFGFSEIEQRPVATILAERLPVSVALNAAALAVTFALAVPLGILGAWRPGGRWDRFGATATTALYAVPVFWMALVLQWIFSVRLGWLPLFGTSSDAAGSAFGRLADAIRHGILPVACLSYGGIAYVSRFTRVTLVENTGETAGRGARARGVSALRYVGTHGLAQASVPLLTLLGFLIPRLVGGSILVEQVFGIPGLGQLLWNAILARDLAVVLALTLVSGVATLGGVTLADLLAAKLDPRLRRAA